MREKPFDRRFAKGPLAVLAALSLGAVSVHTPALGNDDDDDAALFAGSGNGSSESSALPAAEDELSFDQAFARFDTPTLPSLPPEAVDITTIEPAQEDTRSLGQGVASYYGQRFHGRRTANGERFNMRELTAAHKTLPFGSQVRVTNLNNGRSVVVRINDRGPFIRGRHIDLSRRAAEEIGMIHSGHASVRMELIDS